MGEGGGRTGKLLRDMEKAEAASRTVESAPESSVFIWPSGGAHGEETGDDYTGKLKSTEEQKKENNKKYPRDKNL